MTRLRRLLVAPVLLALALGAPLAVPAYAAPSATAAVTVGALRANALTEPLGIDGRAPRLSWQLDGARRGITQAAYQVRVGTSPATLADADVWDSGRIDSGDSVGVRYDGPDLTSHTRYVWSVRVWDDRGTASAWSEPASFETGLLKAGDWSAEWIAEPDSGHGPEWRDYTIELDASDVSGALGVYFRGATSNNAYMWQISEADRSLRPHVKNGGYSVLPATPFPAGFDFAARHTYAIEVSGTTITTSVDGVQLDRRVNTAHQAPGIVGFRTSGAETGLVHAVRVTSADGTVLVDTDFPRGDRTFTGGTVTDDGLRAGAPDHEAWLKVGTEVPLLRDDFELADKPVTRARVYASAQGIYELRLNGERVGDHELAPGWTDYRKRIQHQTYDVTDLLRPGANAWGAELADGWFSGRVAIFGDKVYGDRNALVAQLRVDYADGTTEVFTTDDGWETRSGPRTEADLLDGESYDARIAAEVGDWSAPGYDAAGWEPVDVRPSVSDRLEPQDDQRVRVTQELDATRIDSPTEGAYLYDLGQNMVGRARLTLTGTPGETVRIRFGEVLNQDGTLYTENFRSAKVTDHYTFATDQPETFEPAFTFHGFRYVEVSGIDQAPAAEDVVGVVVGTDGELVSELDTSSDLVDQLHRNIVWGQRGNFLSIPTDTPARDERMGWTGDINVFGRTAVYNMDSQAFLSKWLQDLRDTQRADGALPGVAPVIPGRFDGGYAPAGWADAGIHVPWTLWQAYGDTQVLEDNWEMMTAYLGYLRRTSTGHIRTEGGYLDWLNLDDPTPADVLDTAFYAKGVREMAQMARALGKEAEADEYQRLHRDIRAAYVDAFVSAEGTVKGDSQTGYILTITNDLVPEDRREALTDRFVETIERRDWHLSTGFLGVDGLLPALTAVGRSDVAYRLLQNEDYPSWGYEIGKGATTIWERWNSIMPDGSFGPVDMNSFNHYAYGAVGEWMYRTMAGVSALEPGYRKVLIAPEPGGDIDHSDFTLQTPYGEVRSAWQDGEDGLRLRVSVPANSTAEVRLPVDTHWAVREGGVPADDAAGVAYLEEADGVASFEVGSGEYVFTVDSALGHVGVARDEVGALQRTAGQLTDAGRIRRGVAGYLGGQVPNLDREVADAWRTLAADDRTRAVGEVHRALKRATDLAAWVTQQRDAGKIGDAEADLLLGHLDDITVALSSASADLLAARVSLAPAEGESLPGATSRVAVRIANTGDQTLSTVASALTAPAGWRVAPVGTPAGSVAPGATAVHRYDVTVPVTAEPGIARLDGSASWRVQSSAARVPLHGAVAVAPGVVVDEVGAPGGAEPGELVEVSTSLTNRTAVAQTGSLALELPEGWETPQPQSWSLAAGETRSLASTLRVPVSVTAGPARVVASVGEADGESAATQVEALLPTPPEDSLDHVDLGDGSSERAHAFTASPASGSNVEAGLTRRYTNATQPGGWFEHDLEVTPGEPFALRAVETYDGPAFKTYDLLVDGGVVAERRHRRTASGSGTVTFQVLVDLPQATADGTVRVRWQDVDADHDPSIADVWSVPVP